MNLRGVMANNESNRREHQTVLMISQAFLRILHSLIKPEQTKPRKGVLVLAILRAFSRDFARYCLRVYFETRVSEGVGSVSEVRRK